MSITSEALCDYSKNANYQLDCEIYWFLQNIYIYIFNIGYSLVLTVLSSKVCDLARKLLAALSKARLAMLTLPLDIKLTALPFVL